MTRGGMFSCEELNGVEEVRAAWRITGWTRCNGGSVRLITPKISKSGNTRRAFESSLRHRRIERYRNCGKTIKIYFGDIEHKIRYFEKPTNFCNFSFESARNGRKFELSDFACELWFSRELGQPAVRIIYSNANDIIVSNAINYIIWGIG